LQISACIGAKNSILMKKNLEKPFFVILSANFAPYFILLSANFILAIFLISFKYFI